MKKLILFSAICIAALANALAQRAAAGFGGGFNALTGHVKFPAMERAAQPAILQPAIGEIGAAMRAVAVEQAVPAALVAEQHEILAEHLGRLGEGRTDGRLIGLTPRRITRAALAVATTTAVVLTVGVTA